MNSAMLVWARDRLGMTVEEAAHTINVSPARLQTWESTGEKAPRDYPTLAQLRTIAAKYRQTIAFFLLAEPPAVEDSTRPPDFRRRRPDDRLPLRVLAELDKAAERRTVFVDLADPEPADLPYSPLGDLQAATTVLRDRLGVTLRDQRLDGVKNADDFVEVLSQVIDDTLTTDFWAITLPNDIATSASKSPALLAYIAALNVLDADALLSRGKVRARLDPAITARKGIERHHIFPRAYLKSHLGVQDTKEINQIANMALVEWADNIAISDDAPNEYWPVQLAAKRLPADVLDQQRHWHALPDGWEFMEYPAFLARRRLLMAEVVRDAYARLKGHGYAPAYPEASATGAEPGMEPRHASVSLFDLMEADLLPVGTILRRHDGGDDVATLLPDGHLACGDEIHSTPEDAAAALTGEMRDGWSFWVADTPDGAFTLAALREAYLGTEM